MAPGRACSGGAAPRQRRRRGGVVGVSAWGLVAAVLLATSGLGAATKDDGNGVGSAALEARRAMKVRDAQSRSKAPKQVQPLDLEDNTPRVQLLTDKHLQKANRRLEKSVQHAADNAEAQAKATAKAKKKDPTLGFKPLTEDAMRKLVRRKQRQQQKG